MGSAVLRSTAALRALLSLVGAAAVYAFIRFLKRKARANQKCLSASPATAARPAAAVGGDISSLPPRPTRPVPGAPAISMPPPPSRPPPSLPPPSVCESSASCPAINVSDVELWICLDFEWTCDEGEHREVHSDEGEIIEFSYAVYDVNVQRCVCDGQYYCKNLRTPITKFCTDLTGISDDTLKDAGSLRDALDALDRSLSSEGLAGRQKCAVAHGPADLELMLPRNCKALDLKVPSYLSRYVDLREATQSYLAAKGIRNKRASSLKQICEALKLEMIGDEHCGLDDSWMVLLAFQQLLLNGAELRPVDLVAERDSFLQPSIAPEISKSQPPRCLCFDGLPFFALASEVEPWLKSHMGALDFGFTLYVVLGLDARPSGRAIVDLRSHATAVAVLQAFDESRPLVCGSVDRWPFEGKKERLVVVRPLRGQETGLPLLSYDAILANANGPALAQFPSTAADMDILRGRGAGKGAGKGRPRVQAADGCHGTVKNFNEEKGYGFISFEGGEVFVHRNDCHGEELAAGDEVSFDVVEDPRNRKMKAVDVQKRGHGV